MQHMAACGCIRTLLALHSPAGDSSAHSSALLALPPHAKLQPCLHILSYCVYFPRRSPSLEAAMMLPLLPYRLTCCHSKPLCLHSPATLQAVPLGRCSIL